MCIFIKFGNACIYFHKRYLSDWSKAYSPQQEILEYLGNIAKKHDLYRRIKFNHRVFAIEWDEIIFKWRFKILNKENKEEVHIFDTL